MRNSASRRCRVCETGETFRFLAVAGTAYRRCPVCLATLMEEPLPSREAERAWYATHRNRIDDQGYRRFLGRLALPLIERLAPRSRLLDYGCGPGPALAAMLEEAGHEVALFDPLFSPDPAPLARQYDAVTCTETIEHFHQPALEFRRLTSLVRPGGTLALMTCFQTDDAKFADWHYRRDPTHVVFYREETLRLLAGRYGWEIEIPCKDVALLGRPAGLPPSST